MKTEKILITGGSGMVGHALRRVIPDAIFVSSKDFDLRSIEQTETMFSMYEPEQIIHLAAKVGGIKANMENLGDFYRDNIMINTNILESARKYKTEKVLSLLSTCIYPDKVSYPLTEEQIHTGPPHQSNYAYAHAKRMLDVQSRAYREQYGCNFITAIPNNLYGENDNYDLEDSHVIPAIMHKMHLARQTGSSVTLWGDGTPLREFTYSKDLAEILVFLLEHYDLPQPINVGNTGEHSIKEVAELIAAYVDYDEQINWDISKPAGQLRKPSSNKRLLELGWRQSMYTDFKVALLAACDWFTANYPNIRGGNADG
jgi:GDP-L-fucose synthase